jgi:hypothetical protein
MCSHKEETEKWNISNRENKAKEIIIMENTNFYEKLKAEFPEFITLRLDEQQQGSLKSLIGYTEGALTSYRIEVAEANEKYKIYAEQIRDEKRTEALNAAKAKMNAKLTTFFVSFDILFLFLSFFPLSNLMEVNFLAYLKFIYASFCLFKLYTYYTTFREIIKYVC